MACTKVDLKQILSTRNGDHTGAPLDQKPRNKQKASWEIPPNLETKQLQITQVKLKPSREFLKYFNHMEVRFHKLDKFVG